MALHRDRFTCVGCRQCSPRSKSGRARTARSAAVYQAELRARTRAPWRSTVARRAATRRGYGPSRDRRDSQKPPLWRALRGLRTVIASRAAARPCEEMDPAITCSSGRRRGPTTRRAVRSTTGPRSSTSTFVMRRATFSLGVDTTKALLAASIGRTPPTCRPRTEAAASLQPDCAAPCPRRSVPPLPLSPLAEPATPWTPPSNLRW